MGIMVAPGVDRHSNFRSYADNLAALRHWAPPSTPATTLERGATLAVACSSLVGSTAGDQRRLDGLRDELACVCADVLDAGLLHRAGRFLVAVDRAVHTFIAGGCPDHQPRGVSVCEDCSLIFEHAYATRARCDGCHARPSRRGLLTHEEAGMVLADPATGTVLLRLATCQHCAAHFQPERPARYCSDTCRKRQRRGLPPPAGSPVANAPAVAEIERLVEVARREQEDAERRDPALRAARLTAQREAYAQVCASLAASPVAEQLTAAGSLVERG